MAVLMFSTRMLPSLSPYTMYVRFTAICLPGTSPGSEVYLVIGVTSSCGGLASPGSLESTSCTARSPAPSSLPRGNLLLGILAGDVVGRVAADSDDGGGMDAAESRWAGAVLPSSCISRALGLEPPGFGMGFAVGLAFAKAAAAGWKPWRSLG
jgi:hypothetical protein